MFLRFQALKPFVLVCMLSLLATSLRAAPRETIPLDHWDFVEERVPSLSTSTSASGPHSYATCRLDVFHADRESSWSYDPMGSFPAQLRILSTSELFPIYCYQVVAESASAGPLNYAFATDGSTGAVLAPAGMTIEPHTGKIIWDLYAASAPPGTYPVTVKVSDSAGHTDYQSFTLTVLD